MLSLTLALLLSTPGQHSVSVTLFYDENGDGILEAGERARLPDVVVEMAGQSLATSVGNGRVVFEGLAPGSYTLLVRGDTLPPFYSAPATLSVEVPHDGEVLVPVILRIGANRPNTYLAFGDSLTEGEGSSDGQGFRRRLESRLRLYFRSASVATDGVSGASSDRGVRRINRSLARFHPAYTLVLMGTNDFDEDRDEESQVRSTLLSLQTILERVRSVGSIPVLATIPPTNVGFDSRATPARNRWVSRLDERLSSLASAQGALLADPYGEFLSQGELRSLFVDHVHPNDRGYEIIAESFFRAITKRSEAAGGRDSH